MKDELLYVYGVVQPEFAASTAPAGIDDRAVEVVPAGDLAALVSLVPADHYGAATLETNSASMEWVSPRAVAHDRVLTWAQDHGGIIPMPMFSIWSGAPALRASLAERGGELQRVFERVRGADEYGLRVHRRDRAVLAVVQDLDPELAALRRDAEAASPGQRYLIERKIAERARHAARSLAAQHARDTYDALQPFAREAIHRPLTPTTTPTPDASLVLNAAFLVDRQRLTGFREILDRRMQEGETRGLTFEFTGPWPPYHFVT